MQPSEQSDTNWRPKCGDRFDVRGDEITISRVARDGAWIDIRVWQRSTGARWAKRLRLEAPFVLPGWLFWCQI